MATETTTPIRNSRNMQEVKAPELFQFTKPGQTLSGVLVAIEPVTVKEKQAIEYMFVQENGERASCLGTNDLNKKITPLNIAHWMDVRYERDDTSFQKTGQSPMKIFKVLADKNVAPGYEHLKAS